MKIFLIRHAQTLGNLVSNYVGCTDEPLAPEGIATAQRATPDSSVRLVYTSKLARTIQTAGILYPNATVVSHAGLNEMNFGAFEGRNWRELERDAEYSAWVSSRCESQCPGGEDKNGFSLRCRNAFGSIVREHRSAGTATAHFVVHGGVIMAIMSGLVLPKRDYFSWSVGFCGGFVIESSGNESFTLCETLIAPESGNAV